MAFYKDAPGRKPQKNHSSGSWADEGSEYSGARKPAHGSRPHGDKRYGDKPYGEKRYGDKPGYRKDDRRDNRSERGYDRKPARPVETRPAPSFKTFRQVRTAFRSALPLSTGIMPSGRTSGPRSL